MSGLRGENAPPERILLDQRGDTRHIYAGDGKCKYEEGKILLLHLYMSEVREKIYTQRAGKVEEKTLYQNEKIIKTNFNKINFNKIESICPDDLDKK